MILENNRYVLSLMIGNRLKDLLAPEKTLNKSSITNIINNDSCKAKIIKKSEDLIGESLSISNRESVSENESIDKEHTNIIEKINPEHKPIVMKNSEFDQKSKDAKGYKMLLSFIIINLMHLMNI